MSTKAIDSYQKKVAAIFRELAGPQRAKWLEPRVPSRCFDQIAKAIGSKSGYSKKVARHIAFNLADWNADAAFLVALHLFPERFTDAEIQRSGYLHAGSRPCARHCCRQIGRLLHRGHFRRA